MSADRLAKPKKKPKADKSANQAQRHRNRMAQKSRANYAAAAEIGDLPKVVNRRRKNRCRNDLFKFLVTYFPHSTGLKPLSDDHRRVITYIQNCILLGGLFAQAIFRGFAKTTIGELACLWAALYGHRKYLVLFAWDKTAASELIDDIKTELLENDLLLEDFPEVCYPIRLIDDKPQRARSQTYQGERTYAAWRTDVLVLPTIPDSPASGVIIRARPRNNARGLKFTRPDGVKQRPDFFLADDIQNDLSAASPGQVKKLLNLIMKSWLFLAGHHHKIAGVINGTIIEPDDAMDQLTNPKIREYAVFQSQRIRMVRSWSTAHDTLWLDQYAEIRTSYNADDPDDQRRAFREATEFYLANREAMDAGADVAWEHCYSEDDEVSAIQHAYNLLIDYGKEAFESECQNNPIRDEGAVEIPSAEFLKHKQSGYKRGVVPSDCTKLTAFIDQQDKLLYWMVIAWIDNFTGYIIDYGSFPDQKRNYFTLDSVRRTLKWFFKSKKVDQEGALHAGITKLVGDLMGRTFQRSGGGGQTIDRIAVDTNYGKRTTLIKSVIEQLPHKASTLASYGRGIKARHKQISQWRPQPGREKGPEWVIDRPEGQSIRQLIYDTWFWKKRATDALALALGSKGCLAFFKDDPERHRMVVDHIRSQKAFETEDKDSGQTALEWELRPGEEDHFFDCLVGCMVLASTCGVRRPDDKRSAKTKRRKSVKYL